MESTWRVQIGAAAWWDLTRRSGSGVCMCVRTNLCNVNTYGNTVHSTQYLIHTYNTLWISIWNVKRSVEWACSRRTYTIRASFARSAFFSFSFFAHRRFADRKLIVAHRRRRNKRKMLDSSSWTQAKRQNEMVREREKSTKTHPHLKPVLGSVNFRSYLLFFFSLYFSFKISN